jgi:glycosyltransferase involved in cell wall biosynthesis
VRIAQIAPIYSPVPPKKYGGVERVVSYLTEELVANGHDVTLFASSDSTTTARLVSPCRHTAGSQARLCETMLLGMLAREAQEFDAIHFHTVTEFHLPLTRLLQGRNLTTCHGTWDRSLEPLYREFADVPIVSISYAQRNLLPNMNWQGTVYHGLPRNLYELQERRGSYLAFLGQMSFDKGPVRAIQIAMRAGVPLKLAGRPVTASDREYFEASVKPLLGHPLVEYIGEIGDHEKQELLGNAFALLFPIADRAEPFGLVMIEAMACGTPTIAYPGGSVAEIIDEGITGFVVDDDLAAVEAVAKVALLDRRHCREAFENRFLASRMVQDYANLYAEPSPGLR